LQIPDTAAFQFVRELSRTVLLSRADFLREIFLREIFLRQIFLRQIFLRQKIILRQKKV